MNVSNGVDVPTKLEHTTIQHPSWKLQHPAYTMSTETEREGSDLPVRLSYPLYAWESTQPAPTHFSAQHPRGENFIGESTLPIGLNHPPYAWERKQSPRIQHPLENPHTNISGQESGVPPRLSHPPYAWERPQPLPTQHQLHHPRIESFRLQHPPYPSQLPDVQVEQTPSTPQINELPPDAMDVKTILSSPRSPMSRARRVQRTSARLDRSRRASTVSAGTTLADPPMIGARILETPCVGTPSYPPTADANSNNNSRPFKKIRIFHGEVEDDVIEITPVTEVSESFSEGNGAPFPFINWGPVNGEVGQSKGSGNRESLMTGVSEDPSVPVSAPAGDMIGLGIYNVEEQMVGTADWRSIPSASEPKLIVAPVEIGTTTLEEDPAGVDHPEVTTSVEEESDSGLSISIPSLTSGDESVVQRSYSEELSTPSSASSPAKRKASVSFEGPEYEYWPPSPSFCSSMGRDPKRTRLDESEPEDGVGEAAGDRRKAGMMKLVRAVIEDTCGPSVLNEQIQDQGEGSERNSTRVEEVSDKEEDHEAPRKVEPQVVVTTSTSPSLYATFLPGSSAKSSKPAKSSTGVQREGNDQKGTEHNLARKSFLERLMEAKNEKAGVVKMEDNTPLVISDDDNDGDDEAEPEGAADSEQAGGDTGLNSGMAQQVVCRVLRENYRITRDYDVKLLLGWGGNGAVLAARRRTDGMRVAIKIIYKKVAMKQSSAATTSDVPAEIMILRQLRHDNIIEFLDWFEDRNSFYLVTERYGGRWTNEQLQKAVDEHRDDGVLRAEHISAACRDLRELGAEPVDDDEIGPEDEILECQVPVYGSRTTPSRGGRFISWRTIQLGVRSGSGDLFSFLETFRCVPHDVRPKIFAKIVTALADMHAKGVIHGDLKEENILIGPAPDFVPKLCDFGHARCCPQAANGSASSQPGLDISKFPLHITRGISYYGTKEMTPPELVENIIREQQCEDEGAPLKPTSTTFKRVSGFAADVWALGLLLYAMSHEGLPLRNEEMVEGKVDLGDYDTYPFTLDGYGCCYDYGLTCDGKGVCDGCEVCEGGHVCCVDEDCYDLMQRMLTIDPSKRITMAEILRHPWIREHTKA
ncbi:hypothetical protein HK102_004569 [Quaeritorhiza haematococci]|nr:hypothetical protein HK102_004569 [Quaeritorhiza haematococci]